MKTTIKTNNGRSNEREFNFEFNFVDGSALQQELAAKILTSKLQDIFGMVSQYTGEKFDKAAQQGVELGNKFASVTSAIYWIDNKNEGWKEIYKSL